MYMRIHISLLNCRGAEKMPARPCPIRSVRSGPVRPVCPVRALWAQGTGADRTDRTGPDGTPDHLICLCLKSEGVLFQNKLLDQK